LSTHTAHAIMPRPTPDDYPLPHLVQQGADAFVYDKWGEGQEFRLGDWRIVDDCDCGNDQTMRRFSGDLIHLSVDIELLP
jgi:hypothetical protein